MGPGTKRWRRCAERAAWRRLGDEILVVDLARNEVLGLSPVAAAIWELISESRSASELASALGWPEDPEAIREIGTFADRLAECGLADVSMETTASSLGPVPAPPMPWVAPEIAWRESMSTVVGASWTLPEGSLDCLH